MSLMHFTMPVKINMRRDDLDSLIGTAKGNVVRMPTEFKEENTRETKDRKIILIDNNMVHHRNKLTKVAHNK